MQNTDVQGHDTQRVSIALPAYNAAATIATAIESVIAQTHEDWELIVCDDASTDETPRELERFCDPRIKLLRNACNQGEGKTRDRALAAATGAWITVLDADDAWHPQRLELLLRAAGEVPDAVVFDDILECHSTSNGMVPWKRMRGPDAFGEAGAPIQITTERWIRSRRMFAKFFFSRELLLSTGAMHSDDAFGADTYFALKLLGRGAPLVYVPTALYWYRLTPGSASSSARRESMLRAILEHAVEDFDDQPAVRSALCEKIARVRREELYKAFVQAIKTLDVKSTGWLLLAHPWLFPWLCWRTPKYVAYHVHRAGRGGQTRGST